MKALMEKGFLNRTTLVRVLGLERRFGIRSVGALEDIEGLSHLCLKMDKSLLQGSITLALK